MSVFECTRCNGLAYSASRDARFACETCGWEHARVLDGLSLDAALEDARRRQGGDHMTAVVAGEGEAVEVLACFVQEGLDCGESVLAVTRAPVQAALVQRLSEGAERNITWVDADEAYGHGFDPVSTVERVCRPGPRRVVGVAEAQTVDGVDPADWERYERLAHERTVELGLVVLCIFVKDPAIAELVEVVRRTHPLVEAGGALRRNPDFAYQPA